MERSSLATLKHQLWAHLKKDNSRFWRVCLKVARSKPHLCAEAVEAEARRIMFGLRPEPRRFGIWSGCFLSLCSLLVFGSRSFECDLYLKDCLRERDLWVKRNQKIHTRSSDMRNILGGGGIIYSLKFPSIDEGYGAWKWQSLFSKQHCTFVQPVHILSMPLRFFWMLQAIAD